MQTSVELQAPFSYSIGLILILLTILVIPIIKKVIENRKNRNGKIEIKELSPMNKERVKQKYIKKLDKIETNINNRKTPNRIAYQNLSEAIRYFVHEMTGIKVQNYTLEDIEKINMPLLYELIKECYTPEFAENTYGNITKSIEKTREVIKKWN